MKAAYILLTSIAPFLIFPFTAQGQDERDEEIFGDRDTATDPAKPAEPSQEQLHEQSLIDNLQIGGRLELRSSTGQIEQQKLPRAPINQLRTADIYFDARPNKEIRAFLRTRFTEQTPPRSASGESDCGSCITTEIDEMWLRWDLHDSVFFTYGKQHLKWGSGRFWNPTDFTAREVRDPFDLFDRRLGQELLKIHIPQEKGGHNHYMVLQFDEAKRNDDIGIALRSEFSVGESAEVAFTAQARRQNPQRIGADISSALGPLDVNLEVARSKRNLRTFYEGSLDIDSMTVPTPYQEEDRWFNQVLAGIRQTYKYSDEDNLTIGGEYFWNELGYEDRELELFSLINGQSQALYAGQRYAGIYAVLPNPGSWNETSFYINGLANLSDKTAVMRLTGTWELFEQATLEAYVGRCVGDYGELCFKVPESYKALAQVASDEIKQLVNALPTRRTVLTAGAGLSINF